MELIGILITLIILICSILAASRTAQILEDLKVIKQALEIETNKEIKLFTDKLEEKEQQEWKREN